MTEKIHLLNLPDEQIVLFALAKHMGLVDRHNPDGKVIDFMLEGAQRTLMFGKELMKKRPKTAYIFELNSQQSEYFQNILENPRLKRVYDQMSQTGGLTQENLWILWSGFFDDFTET